MKGKRDLIKKIEQLLEEKERAIRDKKYDFADRLWNDIQLYLSILNHVA